MSDAGVARTNKGSQTANMSRFILKVPNFSMNMFVLPYSFTR